MKKPVQFEPGPQHAVLGPRAHDESRSQEELPALVIAELTAEDHMEIIRNDQYSVLSWGDTQQTHIWLHHVRTGRTAISRLYADELRDRISCFGDRVRVLEEQRTLTHEEHMQIVRAHGYALRSGGDTQQTYTWLHSVKRGATPVIRAYAEELKTRVPGFADSARVLEEQRVLTHEEHMQVIRAHAYTLMPGGATQQTYKWLRDVRSGSKPIIRAHVEELTANIPGFGDSARVLEEQRILTHEEHMQVLRAHDYVLARGGATQQTYTWFHNVRTGVTAAPRAHVEELTANIPGFGDMARVLEEQRILTHEEHMQVLRAHDYVLARGGATQQTYKWLQNVRSGSSRIAQIYLHEIEEARGTKFPQAKVIEEQQELTQADHMKILRSRGFHLPPQGATARTADWLARVLAGEMRKLKGEYAAEIAAMTAARVEGEAGELARTR
ncbi:hypothetical protein ABZT06_48730 [Streptomyces sp. NPDC005483]|uniref:hypothetical protein n=1 Tax=Streptomyces sp. NPDC005483 TaxID=3154882 RepID=UPI0033BDF04A